MNSILPMVNHIHTETIIANCLRIRRLELKNWKDMLGLKMRRTEQSDMIEFLALYKNIQQI